MLFNPALRIAKTLAFIDQKTKIWIKNKKMIKRNGASILIIISSIIGILNVEFSNISEPKNYWNLIISSFIILASVVLIYSTESKFKKNIESE